MTMNKLMEINMGKPVHRITSFDKESMTGQCIECGPADVYYRPAVDRYICRNKKRKDNARRNELRWARGERGYGITLDTYDAMLKEQNYVCKICKEPCPTGRKLAVDHDHTTGQVRGLLCLGCNVGLGHFNDDVNSILEAATYLMSFENVLEVQ